MNIADETQSLSAEMLNTQFDQRRGEAEMGRILSALASFVALERA
jgi:hypothetical protein